MEQSRKGRKIEAHALQNASHHSISQLTPHSSSLTPGTTTSRSSLYSQSSVVAILWSVVNHVVSHAHVDDVM